MLSSILVFFLVLSVLVLVHELGHFLVAKRSGILVEEFGFGLPPRLVSVQKGETLYSLNLLPFGGFVKLHGEDNAEKLSFPKRSFSHKSKKIRFSVIIAGVLMNFLLAVAAFGVVYSFSGIPRETGKVKIVDVSPGSPAQVAKIVAGEVILKVDQKEVKQTSDFIKAVEAKKGKKVVLETDQKKVTVAVRESPPEGEGPIGVVISTTEIYFPPIILRPFYGVYYGFKDAFFWAKNVLTGFGSILANLFSGRFPKDIAGPIGIFAVTSAASQFGLLAVVNLLGILSVNLAILNILPLPALDGGRLLFIALEGVVGRKVLPKLEATIHTVGMIILLVLLLAISAYDIQRLVKAGSIGNFLNSTLK